MYKTGKIYTAHTWCEWLHQFEADHFFDSRHRHVRSLGAVRKLKGRKSAWHRGWLTAHSHHTFLATKCLINMNVLHVTQQASRNSARHCALGNTCIADAVGKKLQSERLSSGGGTHSHLRQTSTQNVQAGEQTFSYTKYRGILSGCAISQLQHTSKDAREVLCTRTQARRVFQKLKTNKVPNLHV